jgi:hypothetical protein
VDFGLAPAWLLADLSARSGADAEAVEAFRRFRGMYIPTTMWRSWAHPASLATEAEALARLGRHGEARAVADRLLEEWKDAAPEEPLLARALGISGGAGSPALPRGGT